MTRKGISGQCQSPSSCVGVDHDNIDQDVCTLPSGLQGLCCVQNLKNNVVNLGGGTDPKLSSVGVPGISDAEFNAIFDEVENELRNEEVNRKVSVRKNNPVVKSNKNTASSFHRKFNTPRNEIVQIDKDARKLLKVTQKLKDLKNLTDSQTAIGLRSGFNSFTNQRIRKLCPWINSAPVCNQNNFR